MQCVECNKTFNAPSKYKRHLLSHSDYYEFQCICLKRYKTKDNLTRHQKTCQECPPADFTTEAEPAEDQEPQVEVADTKKSTHKTHQCEVCSKTFYSAANLSRHRKTHLPKEYCCVDCPETFTKWTLLQKHKTSVHKFKCKLCEMVLNSRDGLKRHVKVHDENREMFGCQYCLKVFMSAKSRKVHVRTAHLNEKPYECSCGKRFGHKHLLQRHKAAVHKQIQTDGDNEMPSDSEMVKVPENTVKGDVNYIPETSNDANEPQSDANFAKFITGYDYGLQSNDRTIKCYFGGCHSRWNRLYDLERHILAVHQKPTNDFPLIVE